MAPERTKVPGPALTTLFVPEMTPEIVRAAVPYCWTKSCDALEVRFAEMVSATVTVLSTRRPPEVRVRRKLPEIVCGVVPVRRRALTDSAAVRASEAADE